jgi:hypothetical protein
MVYAWTWNTLKNCFKFKMAPESKMEAEICFNIAFTKFCFFQNAVLRSLSLAITKLLKKSMVLPWRHKSLIVYRCVGAWGFKSWHSHERRIQEFKAAVEDLSLHIISRESTNFHGALSCIHLFWSVRLISLTSRQRMTLFMDHTISLMLLLLERRLVFIKNSSISTWWLCWMMWGVWTGQMSTLQLMSMISFISSILLF